MQKHRNNIVVVCIFDMMLRYIAARQRHQQVIICHRQTLDAVIYLCNSLCCASGLLFSVTPFFLSDHAAIKSDKYHVTQTNWNAIKILEFVVTCCSFCVLSYAVKSNVIGKQLSAIPSRLVLIAFQHNCMWLCTKVVVKLPHQSM